MIKKSRTVTQPFFNILYPGQIIIIINKNPLTGVEITPFPTCHSNLSIRNPVRMDIFLI